MRVQRSHHCGPFVHAETASPYGKIIGGIVKSEEGRDDLAIAKLSEVIDGCSLEEAGSVLLANAYFEVRWHISLVFAPALLQ